MKSLEHAKEKTEVLAILLTAAGSYAEVQILVESYQRLKNGTNCFQATHVKLERVGVIMASMERS